MKKNKIKKEFEIDSYNKNFSLHFTQAKGEEPKFLHIESFSNGFGFNLMGDEIHEFMALIFHLFEKTRGRERWYK